MEKITVEHLIEKSYDYISKEAIRLGYLPPLEVLLNQLTITNKRSVAIFECAYKHIKEYLNS